MITKPAIAGLSGGMVFLYIVIIAITYCFGVGQDSINFDDEWSDYEYVKQVDPDGKQVSMLSFVLYVSVRACVCVCVCVLCVCVVCVFGVRILCFCVIVCLLFVCFVFIGSFAHFNFLPLCRDLFEWEPSQDYQVSLSLFFSLFSFF